MNFNTTRGDLLSIISLRFKINTFLVLPVVMPHYKDGHLHKLVNLLYCSQLVLDNNKEQWMTIEVGVLKSFSRFQKMCVKISARKMILDRYLLSHYCSSLIKYKMNCAEFLRSNFLANPTMRFEGNKELTMGVISEEILCFR